MVTSYLLLTISVLFAADLASGHVLECYECASNQAGQSGDLKTMKKDPCFDPVKYDRQVNVTTCPSGTSCYKIETYLFDHIRGKSVSTEM